MTVDQNMFSAEEWQAFGDDAREHLAILEEELLAFERGQMDPDAVARAFRAAHTLKGGAATLGLSSVARLTHVMESRLDQLRHGESALGGDLATAMLRATDALGVMLDQAVATHADPAAADDVVQLLEGFAGSAGAPAAPRPARPTGAPPAAGAFVVTCALAGDCAMPAVRALQVLLLVRETGAELRSQPDQREIEDGWSGDSVSLWLAAAPPEALLDALGRLPDVVEVGWEEAPAEPSGSSEAHPAADGGRSSTSPAAAADERGEAPAARGAASGAEHSVRVDVGLLDALMNLVGELVTERNRLLRIGQELHDQHAQSLMQVTSQLARLTQSLQETVLKARMLPVDRLFRRFPRMIRDLSHQLGKELDFVMEGGDAELDRSVIEAIGDPLVHALRNAVDHGIESPDQREAAGKPRQGRVGLAARQEEGHVVIEVRDDGRGLDPERLRQLAVARGLCSAERAAELTDQDALEVIFAPGFSTAESVSEVSGRGVGMDVVRRNVEAVGGRVEVSSAVGRGTSVALWLPLTLATVRSLLVRVGEATVALPLTAVAEGLRVSRQDVQSVAGRRVLLVRGRTVPLLSLARFLNVPAQPTERETAVLVQVGRELYGLVVDHLLGEQEVVAKPLPAFWQETEGIGGVAILGDGRPALILDLPGVTKRLSLRSA